MSVVLEQGFPTWGTRLRAPITGSKYERAIFSQNIPWNCADVFVELSLAKLIYHKS